MNKAEARYCDNLSGSYIAIKKLPYAGKSRKISIAYIYDSSYVKIKTIHPENDREISNRVKNGRWIKI